VIHCWSSYNQSLVRREEILFAYDFLDIWDDNLARMNENKNGKKYQFPDSFILVIGYIRIYFHVLHSKEGERENNQSHRKKFARQTSYSQICIRRRVNKLDISTKRLDYNDNDDGIVIAVDRTGVKVTNRGLSGCMISRV